jgi:dephospho-CoA kinase
VTTTQNNKRYRIALTGGIASGKSVVADMFAQLGATIIDTDVIARDLVRPGSEALGEIRERFGDEIIAPSGELDRAALRKLIFIDEEARKDLEAILHPRIGAEVRRQAELADGRYQVIVVPLLTGSPLLHYVDRVLVVDCDEATQLERLLARDAGTAEQARRILAAQASREERLAIADDVVSNAGSLAETERQVKKLDKRYRRIARRWRRDNQRPADPA